ncbi:MAG: type II methionyl aminopeptidase [Thermoprotei archaeon]|nr:MAG: type II methionyl aminopeptidase [Thermoprotei archaeon]RLF24507.1 MAG: type II methionyl aminopeptidase [Thermoprotei archaeon]
MKIANIIEEDELRLYERAGIIAAKALEYAMGLAHVDMPIIELCEKIETYIRNSGGAPAFPCNISVNDIAAHYTSPPHDLSRIPPRSLVKIDVGVHVRGYIADTAGTIAFSPEYEPMISVAKMALERAIELFKPGANLGHIGHEIEEVISRHGLRPIRNLTGHLIKPWQLHAGKNVPNVSTRISDTIRSGEVYAIEPFVTSGEGYVVESSEAFIFSYSGGKAKSKDERRLLTYIWRSFRSLPFCERWLVKSLGEHSLEVLRNLVKRGSVYQYPVLREVSGQAVAQWEHTVIVLDREVIVITKA